VKVDRKVGINLQELDTKGAGPVGKRKARYCPD